MNRQDHEVASPRYAGPTLDEGARTVFRATPRQTVKALRKPSSSSTTREKASEGRRG